MNWFLIYVIVLLMMTFGDSRPVAFAQPGRPLDDDDDAGRRLTVEMIGRGQWLVTIDEGQGCRPPPML